MAVYSYPCVFMKEEKGYSACFPDWEKRFGGWTDGESWPQALYMAEDLLNIMCYYTEEDGVDFPEPTDINSLQGIVRMINANTEEYGKAVKLTRQHGFRWRLAEKARKRYLYPKMPQTPEG